MERTSYSDTEAFVTLATNDQYAFGALTLGQSLRNVGTTRQLAVVVTAQVSQGMRRQLTMIYDHIQQVDPLDSHDAAHLALLARPELGITFSKIHCWTLTQYTKCVFLDADCLVLKNVDDLFDREELSAAPDVGWPDCFNSGVFVFRPSLETHRGLLQCAVTQGSFDGGDQGLLNIYFRDWATKDISRHLPFIYNMTSSVSYSYLPAYRQFGQDVRIVHFIGLAKPWLYTYNVRTGYLSAPEGKGSGHDEEFVRQWWSIFTTHIKPRIEHDQRISPPSETMPSTHSSCLNPRQEESLVEERKVEDRLKDPLPEDSKSIPTVTSSKGSETKETGKDLANKFGDLKLDDSTASARSGSPRAGQHAWERGEIDYQGSDRFEVILDQIKSTIEKEDEPKEAKLITKEAELQ
ncbi:Glycogenin-1 [Holothuria leucospilota]|uniref:glycogenin glucosyltransferase n=1 Tax=Holothuria leucospilota TaxID=206669 RepID=A0A9Q1BQ09_HOLLE|nr:Glycogenin-1 [Holothuria leucospilota]